MTKLYIVPVGEDWIEDFQRTVASPTPVPDVAPPDLRKQDSSRIWGTTEGRQKRAFFEEMEAGDPMLFYNDGKFFAAGRAGTSFESQEAGDVLWDSPESRFIYTVTDFQEIEVPRERIAVLLGYEEGWVPYRFLRVSPDAANSLLRHYNSIEEAFQDFQTETSIGESEEKTDEGEDYDSEPRKHTEIQWYLVQLGIAHGYDVYVAKNDKNREYDGERLGESCMENLNLPGFSPAATGIIEYVDVIWLEGDFITKMFEVESTTSVYSGILRMTDFMVRVPNIAVDMHVVAPSSDEDKVRKEIDRPTFQSILEPAEHCNMRYLSFDDVRDTYETVERAGPLQDLF